MPKYEGVYRAGGGSWYFKASLGHDPLTGKRIQLTKRGFSTATDAARARREAVEAVDGEAVHAVAGSLTVDELLDLYLDGIDADGRLSVKTRFDYRRNADAYVRPWLGRRKVRELTPETILTWQRELLEHGGTKKGKPLAANSVRLARASLAGAVKLAVERGLLRLNPSARLGHRDKATTLNIYSHALPATDVAAADFMGVLLSSADVGGPRAARR